MPSPWEYTGVLLILQVLSGSHGVFQLKPTNLVVVKGGTATFTCNGEITDVAVLWQRSKVGDAYNYQILSGMAPRIVATFNSIFIWQTTLTINNVETGDAGMYECTLIQTNLKAYAELVVLETNPVCTGSPSLTAIPDGSSVTTTCQMNVFSAVNYYPTATWTANPGATALTPTTGTATNVWTSKVTETIACAQRGRTYSVVVTFPAFAKATYLRTQSQGIDHSLAAAVYNVNNTWTSPAMVVFCQLSQIFITPTKAVYDIGEVITCSSDGQAPVQYGWTGALTISGPQATIASSMRGASHVLTCAATQVYQGGTFSASKAISFSVSKVHTKKKQPKPVKGYKIKLKGNMVSHSQGHHHLKTITILGTVFIHCARILELI